MIVDATKPDGTTYKRWANLDSGKTLSCPAFAYAVSNRTARRKVRKTADETEDAEEDEEEEEAEEEIEEAVQQAEEEDEEDELQSGEDEDDEQETRRARLRQQGAGQEMRVSTRPIPKGPNAATRAARETLSKHAQRVLAQVEALFAERPMWSRIALANCIADKNDRQLAIQNKALLPQVAYYIVNGPWKDSLVRYGYDPREEPEARFYQRLAFKYVNRRDGTRMPSAKDRSRKPSSVPPLRSSASAGPESDADAEGGEDARMREDGAEGRAEGAGMDEDRQDDDEDNEK